MAAGGPQMLASNVWGVDAAVRHVLWCFMRQTVISVRKNSYAFQVVWCHTVDRGIREKKWFDAVLSAQLMIQTTFDWKAFNSKAIVDQIVNE